MWKDPSFDFPLPALWKSHHPANAPALGFLQQVTQLGGPQKAMGLPDCVSYYQIEGEGLKSQIKREAIDSDMAFGDYKFHYSYPYS